MTFYVEVEADQQLDVDIEKVFEAVALKALEIEECPYEAEINLIITDDENIHEMNNEYRDIDRSTDVLSFPMVEYEKPGDFSNIEDEQPDCFNPETGELMLGDIVISAEHVKAQAKEYGHTLLREFSFLIAHSMLHLMGYDHMSPEEEKLMFSRQEEILSALNINR